MRTLVLGGAIALAVGCGARSSLLEGGSAAGAGGGGAPSASSSGSQTATSSSSGGGTTSSTGGAGPCLMVTGDRFKIPGTDGFAVVAPRLVAIGNHGQAVALVARADSNDPSAASEVVVTEITAWSGWPPAVEPPVHLAVTRAHAPFQTATSYGGGAFTLLVDADPSGALGAGLRVAFDARVNGAATFEAVSPDHADPLFVRYDLEMPPMPPMAVFGASVVDASGGAETFVQWTQKSGADACGTAPLVGAASNATFGTLAALSTQASDEPCPTPTLGRTSAVVVRRLSQGGGPWDTETLRFPLLGAGAGPVTRLVWVDRYDGPPWLIAGDGSGQSANGLQVIGVKADGTAAGGPRVIPVATEGAFGAARWQEKGIFGFALATPADPLVLRAFLWQQGQPGSDDFTEQVDLSAVDPPGKEVDALEHSSGDTWLVAWSETPPGGNAALYVARLSCFAVPPP